MAERVLETGASTGAGDGVQRCCNRPSMALPTMGTATTPTNAATGKMLAEPGAATRRRFLVWRSFCWNQGTRQQRCYNQQQNLLELAPVGVGTGRPLSPRTFFCWNQLYVLLQLATFFATSTSFGFCFL
ncbi:hypothetical protein VPH35_129101 [Triticum aestivum]